MRARSDFAHVYVHYVRAIDFETKHRGGTACPKATTQAAQTAQHPLTATSMPAGRHRCGAPSGNAKGIAPSNFRGLAQRMIGRGSVSSELRLQDRPTLSSFEST